MKWFNKILKYFRRLNNWVEVPNCDECENVDSGRGCCWLKNVILN